MKGKNYSGLTLCDLLAILSIATIVLAVAGLNFIRFSIAHQLQQATREVTSDLQFFQRLAVKENQDIHIFFQTNRYEIIRTIDNQLMKSRNFIEDYPGISLSQSSIRFNSRGHSIPATVTLSHWGGSKNIVVTSTGQVKLP